LRPPSQGKAMEKKKNDHNISVGRGGEERARKYLEKLGYSIVETNYRTPRGEIDIIARQGGEIVFVEVKTRKSDRLGAPAEAVDQRKQARLRNLALSYLKKIRSIDAPCRFDVISINLEKECLEHLKGAF
jgi:putative endonuclease